MKGPRYCRLQFSPNFLGSGDWRAARQLNDIHVTLRGLLRPVELFIGFFGQNPTPCAVSTHDTPTTLTISFHHPELYSNARPKVFQAVLS